MFTLSCYLSAVYNVPFLSDKFLFWLVTIPSLHHLSVYEYWDATTLSPLLTSCGQCCIPVTHLPPAFCHYFSSCMKASSFPTNVRASQKTSSPSLFSNAQHFLYQLPVHSCFGPNPLASLVDDSHGIPHIPTSQLHLCPCPVSNCFKQS